MPEEENKKLITVTWPVHVPPLCLELVLGTRVCAVRVDSAAVLQSTVRGVPLLAGLPEAGLASTALAWLAMCQGTEAGFTACWMAAWL